MGQVVLAGDPPVEISVRRSARARRVSLRVSGLDGRVTLSMPKRMAMREAMAFAEEKADWIRKHLSRRLDPVNVAIGSKIAFQGKDLPIIAADVRRAEISLDQMLVPDAPEMAPARIKAILKLQARAVLTHATEHYAARVNRSFGKITLRDTRSRWGSCTTAGDLMYSWRLIMAPPEVLDYVAAHEVSHLVELNHSPAYWAVVARICPDYAAPRQWLRQNGQYLHRYRFDD